MKLDDITTTFIHESPQLVDPERVDCDPQAGRMGPGR